MFVKYGSCEATLHMKPRLIQIWKTPKNEIYKHNDFFILFNLYLTRKGPIEIKNLFIKGVSNQRIALYMKIYKWA